MNTPKIFHYFAYGSNLKLSEIHRSCPSAVRVCRAKLPDHRLTFPRESTIRKCGVASAEPANGSEVWGGIYTIFESDRLELQKREGYKADCPLDVNSYYPKDVTVL